MKLNISLALTHSEAVAIMNGENLSPVARALVNSMLSTVFNPLAEGVISAFKNPPLGGSPLVSAVRYYKNTIAGVGLGEAKEAVVKILALHGISRLP